ncbi:MAG: hypothetical protein AB7N65_30970, partial [Vicinamibacterales bacterium]
MKARNIRTIGWHVPLAALLIVTAASAVRAQAPAPAGGSATSAGAVALPPGVDGPPPPLPPATVTRDEAGRATIRAVRVQAPLRVDGRLDEPLYTTALPNTDFIQHEPHRGLPSSEKTD